VTLLIVDAANVVGSVPDGWWRDRPGAARRLRDSLVPVAVEGLAGIPGPLEVTLVVEGAARGIEEIGPVRVVAATGTGDDTITEIVSGARDRIADIVVVTADRGLRERVMALGARVVGPRTLPYR